MENQIIIAKIIENTTWILRQEKTKELQVWERLYPLLQFTERLKDVIEGISKLEDKNGIPHPSWMFLMRPIMLDGIYIIYAIHQRRVGNDHQTILNDMLGDGLNRIESHANRQKKWGVISEDEYTEMISTFRQKFSHFYDEVGDLNSVKMPTPDVLVGKMYEDKKFLFNIAQDFYTKYIVLSKFEHYNILSKEIREIIKINHYLKMAFIHMVYLSDLILGVEGSVTSKERVEELIGIGRIIEPNYFL